MVAKGSKKIGATLCGLELVSYLSILFEKEKVESIINGIGSEQKYTVLAIDPFVNDMVGKGIHWSQYVDPPIGFMRGRDLIERILLETNYMEWFEIELWEHQPPNCMILKDRNSSHYLIDMFSKGLKI